MSICAQAWTCFPCSGFTAFFLLCPPSTSWLLFSFWKSEYRPKGVLFQGCGLGLFLSFLQVCNFLSTWAFFPSCPCQQDLLQALLSLQMLGRCCCGHTLSSLSSAACSPSHLCAALHKVWGWKPVCISWSHLWGGCSKLPEIALLHEHLLMGWNLLLDSSDGASPPPCPPGLFQFYWRDTTSSHSMPAGLWEPWHPSLFSLPQLSLQQVDKSNELFKQQEYKLPSFSK